MILYILFSIFSKYWTENHEAVLYQPYFFKSRYYRIPAITTAKDGSLVAATDMRWENKNDLPAKISTTIRISPDDGLSWTDNKIISGEPRDVGDGDPAIVTDRKTGIIVCLWTGDRGFRASTQSDPQHIYVTRSLDNGRTWEPKRDITSSIYSNLCTNCSQDRYTWSGMFISSGNILQLRDGRLMAAGVTRCWGQIRIYTVYSDDIGLTWNAYENPASKTADESKFFERNDGVVVVSVRHKPTRIFAFSPDRGMTWENETSNEQIWDSPCNGEVIRYTSTIDGYDKDRLIHTVTYVQNFPRRNVSILLSYDEGKTWPVMKTLRGDPNLLGSYSTISIGHTGLIHIYYEKGTDEKDADSFNMTVHTISLEWLTDGADTYRKAENLQWCVCEKDDTECTIKCPLNFYRSSNKVFDQYVESYFEYPTKMKYVFPVGVRDFFVNLSVHGLKEASYCNKKVTGDRPVISFVGLNDLDDKEEADEKNFLLENINAAVNFDQFFFNKFKLNGSSVLTVSDKVRKIEVGKTQIRLTAGSSYNTKSNTVLVDGNDAKLNVLNDVTDEKMPLEICNGINDMQGEEEARLQLVVTAAKPQTALKISGVWKNDEGKKITIESKGQNTGTKVFTSAENKDQFTIDGTEPSFEYAYPPQTPTPLPAQTETPTKEPTEKPTKEPTPLPAQTETPTKEPTKEPTETPTKEPTKEPTPLPAQTKTPTSVPTKEPTKTQTTDTSSDSSLHPTNVQTSTEFDNDSNDSKINNKNTTMMIVIIAVAVVVIIAVAVLILVFAKMKKNKKFANMKSGNVESQPLNSPLLF